MNILVKAPLKANEIQQLLDGTTAEGLTFQFVEKNGMAMEFEVIGESVGNAIDVVKALIRGTDYGSALYFSVVKK